MNIKYDIVIIGGGPAGYEAAFTAAKNDLKIAIIEKEKIGGTCLHYGCIPTKSILLNSSKKGSNWELIEEAKRDVVEKLSEGLEFRLKKAGIALIKGDYTLVSENMLAFDDNTIEFDFLIIATGSRSIIPNIEGIKNEGVCTSKEILSDFSKEFKSITIIGGGVIGSEFATIFNNLGVEVNVVEAKGSLLPDFDKEIGQNLKMIMKKRGVNIYTSSMVKRIEATDNGLNCVYENNGEESILFSEKILVCIGRVPNIDFIKRSKVKVETEKGHIKVDKDMRTNIPNIYAIGDAMGGVQLAHVASSMGRNVINFILNKADKIDMDIVPGCVYTNPEIATVGLDEKKAKERGVSYQTAKYPMSANGKTVINGEDRGFIKILYSQEDERILGAQIMCGRATEMISELSLAIKLNATLKDIRELIHPHPTFSEGIFEAANK